MQEDAVMATLHAKRQNSKRLQQTLVEVRHPPIPPKQVMDVAHL